MTTTPQWAPPHPLPDAVHTSVTEALTQATERATQATTTRGAIHAAWQALHHHPNLTGHHPTSPHVVAIGAAFRAWCDAEDYDRHPSGLAEVLRRRYDTPTAVAESLARAAKLHAGTGGGQ